MTSAFGSLLRRERKARDLSMRQIAKHLGVSVAFLSDVERGTRAPLRDAHIYAVAQLLVLSPEPFLRAAAIDRGVFTLEAPPHLSTAKLDLGAALVAAWDQLTDEQASALVALFQGARS